MLVPWRVSLLDVQELAIFVRHPVFVDGVLLLGHFLDV